MPLLALAIVIAVIFLVEPKDQRPRRGESLWSTSTAFTAEDRLRESERRREEMCRRDGVPFKPRHVPKPLSAREKFQALLYLVVIVAVVMWAVTSAYDY